MPRLGRSEIEVCSNTENQHLKEFVDLTECQRVVPNSERALNEFPCIRDNHHSFVNVCFSSPSCLTRGLPLSRLSVETKEKAVFEEQAQTEDKLFQFNRKTCLH